MLIVEHQSYGCTVVSPPLCGVSERQGTLAVESAARLVLYESVASVIIESEAVASLPFTIGVLMNPVTCR